MNVWTRTLVYLGLREEEDDQPVDWQAEDDSDSDGVTYAAPAGQAQRGYGAATDVAVQHVSVPASRQRPTDVSNVRPLRSGLDVSADRVAVVQVQEFDDVEAIGSRYRLRHPVLFDVTGCSREVARRAVDFVAGLTFASHGSLRRTAPRAFLLVPDGVDISLEERRRLAQLGYDVDGAAR
jgi:cell division inhibitor SepF